MTTRNRVATNTPTTPSAPSAPPEPSEIERRAARAGAIAWAAALIARPDVIYIDTETTGLDGAAEVLEVGVVDGAGRTLLETFVRPDGPIPADATRLHGIDAALVADAPRWDAVYPRLAALLRGPVVVYNAEFDLRLVNQMNQRFGFAPLPSGWQCAMRQYAAFAAVWHARYGGYRYHKLEAALAAFGHAPSVHRAAADASACRLVVEGMARGAAS